MSVCLSSFGAALKSGNVFYGASFWLQLIAHTILAKNYNGKASKIRAGEYQLNL